MAYDLIKRIRGVAAPPTLTRHFDPSSQQQAGTNLMAEIRTITPADAALLLEKNTSNRTLNKAAVNRYAAMMARDEWHIGNDAICIGRDGLLLNGQHRLNAVVLAEKAQQFLVRVDVDQADLKAMDQGNKRIGADIATLLGHKMTRAQSKALRILGTDWPLRNTIATPSVDELIALNNEWAELLDQAGGLLAGSKRNLGIPAAAAAEALRWDGLAGREQAIADFFSIMWDNTPASDRATDSKHEDFIPCQFHRYANNLARENKQLRNFHQYKLVLVGLHSYICKLSLTRATKLDIPGMALPSSNPFRG